MSNKSMGTKAEHTLGDRLYEKGFWVHECLAGAYGQPADLIAATGKRTWLLEVKVVSGTRFPLSRIEQNQHTARMLWEVRVGMSYYYVFYLPDYDEFYFADWQLIKHVAGERVSVSSKDIKEHFIPFEKWCKDQGVWERKWS